MHPAPSIILFTTLSGVGYGLLGWLGVFAALGVAPLDRLFGVGSLVVALGLITIGLMSSTLHLGHPERAWRAMSQWRSSWLSREGIASLATYVLALAFAGLWLFGATGAAWRVWGALSAAGAIATVFCTAMIYRSLKPIRQWCNAWVVPGYLLLAAMTGLIWLIALSLLRIGAVAPGVVGIAALLLILSAVLKAGYWRWIDANPMAATAASATGLKGAPIRPLDPPHTADSYLLKEMGYRIARRHATKLRWIAIVVGFVWPLGALAGVLTVDAGAARAIFAVSAAAAATAGVLVERWLFFAEARHTVVLYYQPDTASSAV